jgi:hypothetical protein
MKEPKRFRSVIKGHLDILVDQREDEFEGATNRWNEVLIHGDPEGLRSFAKLLLKIADLDQDTVAGLPVGAREHYHLRPKFELANSSVEVIVGRLDAKGTGDFYYSYVPKQK